MLAAIMLATLIFEGGHGNGRTYEGIRRRLVNVDYCLKMKSSKRAYEEIYSMKGVGKESSDKGNLI